MKKVMLSIFSWESLVERPWIIESISIPSITEVPALQV
jgi:hypothetical protein